MTLKPFMRAPPSCPSYFPKVLPPNPMTLEVSISTYFGGDIDIQSIAMDIYQNIYRHFLSNIMLN